MKYMFEELYIDHIQVIITAHLELDKYRFLIIN